MKRSQQQPLPGFVCPMCRQPIPVGQPKRVCFLCNTQIVRHDKWVFEGGRTRHRHCDNRESYLPREGRK